MNSQISIVRCGSYDPNLVLESTRKAVDLLGGITNFIKPESKVLVKPNMLMAKEPQFGVDTHPEVVRAVLKLLKEINCKIYVGDGPSVWGSQIENVDRVYETSGIKAVINEEGVELVKFKERRWRSGLPLAASLDEVDYFINIPKFKTHEFTLLTGAIKNLFGLVWGTYKTELHKNYFKVEDFARILVDIYQEAKPSLTIVDGIVAMEGDGPATSGKLRNLNLLLAGVDCVAVDSVMSLIMGIKPLDVATTKEAAGRGLGSADLKYIVIKGEKLEDVIGRPFLLPKTSLTRKLPPFLVNKIKSLIKYYPFLKHDSCIRCGACIEVCPNKIISLKNNRIVIDYSQCIACFCCQEVCPEAAIKVKKSILAKIIGL